MVLSAMSMEQHNYIYLKIFSVRKEICSTKHSIIPVLHPDELGQRTALSKGERGIRYFTFVEALLLQLYNKCQVMTQDVMQASSLIYPVAGAVKTLLDE